MNYINYENIIEDLQIKLVEISKLTDTVKINKLQDYIDDLLEKHTLDTSTIDDLPF
jgi:hypothetical protein